MTVQAILPKIDVKIKMNFIFKVSQNLFKRIAYIFYRYLKKFLRFLCKSNGEYLHDKEHFHEGDRTQIF